MRLKKKICWFRKKISLVPNLILAYANYTIAAKSKLSGYCFF